MKKVKALIYIPLLVLYLIINACSSENTTTIKERKINQESDKYYQFAKLTLSDFDFNAAIFIPDETAGIGASFKPIISHEEDFKWTISAGPNFTLFIEDYGDYSSLMDDFESKISKSDFFDISIISKKNGIILYQRSIKKNTLSDASSKENHISFHLYAIKNINGIYYELKNKEEGNTKKVIELMEKSVESLKLIK
ncbi:MAG: hypothetical protein RL059_253 [Bacteroidota bacterium]